MEREREREREMETEREREGERGKRSIMELPYAGDPSKSAYEPGFCVW